MPGSMSILGVRGWVYQVHPWYTPWKVHPPYWNLVVVVATETGGRHSTGMLSCVQLIFLIQLKAVTRCLDDVVSGKFAFSCYDFVSANKLQHWKCLPPGTKLGQGNVFTPVCHSVHGGGLPHTHPWTDTPRADSPPCAVHAGIRSTSGRYVSYWNAILFIH